MINNAVKDWTKKMDVQPSEETMKLYLSLIGEEYLELMVAINDKNFIETLDALSDLKVVITGLQIMLGQDPSHNDQIVMDSNNSKFITTKQVAMDSVAKYKKQGIDTHIASAANELVILRTKDNKIMKPTTFKTPDWSGVIPPEYWDKI